MEPRLLNRIEAMNEAGEKKVVKTWSRSSTIFPEMVGHTIAVHDGRKHVLYMLLKSMVGVTNLASSHLRVLSVAMTNKKG